MPHPLSVAHLHPLQDLTQVSLLLKFSRRPGGCLHHLNVIVTQVCVASFLLLSSA